jgi:hypothetical protein
MFRPADSGCDAVFVIAPDGRNVPQEFAHFRIRTELPQLPGRHKRGGNEYEIIGLLKLLPVGQSFPPKTCDLPESVLSLMLASGDDTVSRDALTGVGRTRNSVV